MSLKVVFLGNHTVGVRVIDVLNRYGCLYGVVAHPDDSEDGIRYLSVYEYSKKLNIPVVRTLPKTSIFKDFINQINPELLFVADYRYLLSEEIFSKTKFGAVNLHPSLLPKYRGRASLNWAMINGEREVGLTAHFIDNGVDTGDIIKQVPLTIKENDYIGDVLNNIYPLYTKITEEVIESFISRSITRQKQGKYTSSIYPARKPSDGVIDCTKDVVNILNFIKALSKPYPGAFLNYNGKKFIIWSAEKSNETFSFYGIHKKNENIYLQCQNGTLKVLDYTISIDEHNVK